MKKLFSTLFKVFRVFLKIIAKSIAFCIALYYLCIIRKAKSNFEFKKSLSIKSGYGVKVAKLK